jgi:tetratricopeptide (TPR) repeat protein
VAVAALGESLVGQKKFDDAIAAMTTALEAKSDQAYAYFWRGQAYDNKKQTAKMAADYKEFLRLAPKAPEAATVQAILAACVSSSEGLAQADEDPEPFSPLLRARGKPTSRRSRPNGEAQRSPAPTAWRQLKPMSRTVGNTWPAS